MMTETLYLIAHKVRGQPAFDIAIQMEMDDEVWWIIPTSGHRAYPYWNVELSDAVYRVYGEGDRIIDDVPPMPDPWPDHYWQPGQTSDLEIPNNAGASLLAALGFAPKPTTPIKRRF